MRKKYPNLVRLLVVLAMVCGLVALVAAPASADVGASLSVASGPVGTPVTITVNGAIPSAFLIAKFDGVQVTTIPPSPQANAGGNATFGFIVPAAVAGAHLVTASDGVTFQNQAFTVLPKVTVSPTSGPVGTSVTVTGTGFTEGFNGAVFIGAGNLTLAPFSSVVNNTGGFTAIGNIPALPSGNQSISAKDNAGAETAPAQYATFRVTPTISVSPPSGLAGTVVALAGSGWTAGNITISFAGGVGSVVPPVADANGQYAAAYTIPATAALGESQIRATDTLGLTATATFTVVARALTLTPASGPRGTIVLITGANMSTGTGHSIGIGNLTFGGNSWNTTAIAIDTGGVISPTTSTVLGNFTVGANTVQARDDLGKIATATFTVTRPAIAINPATGPKGSTVVVTGSGWVPGKLVTIKIDGVAAQTVIPDATGNIAATANMPGDAAPGAHTFTADDTFLNASAAVVFTIPGAAITVTPNSGVATTTVALSGTGFRAYFPITVTIGGYPLTSTSPALTNALGALITYTFNVPGLAPGVQVILVADGTNTATTFFTITAAPVSISNQLAGISSVLVRVWGYYGGQWQMYDPAPPASGDLATMTAGRGYWINVSANTTLVSGAYSYALTSGWNLIGWR